MILVLEHVVIIHKSLVVLLVHQLVVADVIVIVVVGIPRAMWCMKHRLSSSSLLFCPVVRVTFRVAEDEPIEHVHLLSIPILCGPEVMEGCDFVDKSPEEEEQGDHSDREPVHFLRNARLVNARAAANGADIDLPYYFNRERLN